MTTLLTIYRRQGVEVEDWSAYESHKTERKAQNVENARDVLRKNQIGWSEVPHRIGKDQLIAFIVANGSSAITLYPEVGKYYLADGKERYGVRKLARYITGG